MNKQLIEIINKFFEEHNLIDSYHVDDEYVIDSDELDLFTEFITIRIPDLVNIPCRIGSGTSIWFSEEDLENAVID